MECELSCAEILIVSTGSYHNCTSTCINTKNLSVFSPGIGKSTDFVTHLFRRFFLEVTLYLVSVHHINHHDKQINHTTEAVRAAVKHRARGAVCTGTVHTLPIPPPSKYICDIIPTTLFNNTRRGCLFARGSDFENSQLFPRVICLWSQCPPLRPRMLL